jgi:hypothetical protein
MELQSRIHALNPKIVVIMMTAFASVDTAVRALKQGAFDYVTKPIDPDELSHLVARALKERRLEDENSQLKETIAELSSADFVIGESPAMHKVMEMIRQVAQTNATVMIRGESGTGKELVARTIHANSARKYFPSCPSTAGPCPTACSKASSSDTKRAPSPAPTSGARAAWKWPTAEPCSSTRSAPSRPRCRSTFCAPSKPTRSCAWAARARCTWISASSAPPTRIWKNWWPTGASARISITASTCSASPCRPCASGARTFPRWPGTSWASWPWRWTSACPTSAQKPTRSSWPTIGPATCASWPTPSSAPWW